MQTNLKQYYYKDMYKHIDGFYFSYWSGKLNGTLMRNGNKHTIEKNLYETYRYIKVRYEKNPLEVLLESIEKIKPMFITGFITKGGKKREYPVYLSPIKQYKLSIRWISALILTRKEYKLNQRVYNELLSIYDMNTHVLIKRRDELFLSGIDGRFNIRYAFK